MATSGPATRPLRILVVTNLYPSTAHPAFGTFVGERVAALRRAGERVDVAAITDDRVHRGIARKYLRLGLGALWAAIRHRLRGEHYDIVEAHIAFPTGLLAWPVARIAGAPLVLFAHGSDVARLPWTSSRRERAARWLFRRADLVIANSRFTADIAERRLGPLRRPVPVVSPGIVIEPDRPADAATSRASDHVVYVGRLVPGKGAAVLVEAATRLVDDSVDVRLTLVGDGESRSELEAQATRLGDRVTFRGGLAPSTVRSILASATVVAVPSTQDEGLGLVTLEAMAAGAIVVTTALGGGSETVRDGENAIVVPPGDVDALRAALRSALASAATAEGERLRAGGRATAAAHDIDSAVATTLRAYRDLLD